MRCQICTEEYEGERCPHCGGPQEHPAPTVVIPEESSTFVEDLKTLGIKQKPEHKKKLGIF